MSAESDEDETALFREAIRGVKPLAQPTRVSSDTPKPRPRARFTRADEALVLEETLHGSPDEPEMVAADPTVFARPGVSANALRKLRRGQYRVQAELDLHGLTAAAANAQLREFLIEAVQSNVSCLRIVHGKGLRSGPKGPVLRQLVNKVLTHTRQVLAFCSARQADGGTGAVYVLLSPRA